MSESSIDTPRIGSIFHLRFKPEDGIKLKSSDTYRYPFLDHDSFIDCSDSRIMTMERFSDSRNRGLCGQLDENDMNRVLDYCVMSPTSTAKDLRRFKLI